MARFYERYHQKNGERQAGAGLKVEAGNDVCECGNRLGSPLVSPKSKYTTFGWFLVSMGISHPPVKVVFTCDNCGKEFKTITDKKLLREHIYR